MANFTTNNPITTDTPFIQVDGLASGVHRFQLVVVDDSGNSSLPYDVNIKVNKPAPVIAGIRPAFGKWGDQVTIYGGNFDPDPQKNAVYFNGVNAQVVSSTESLLVVSVPQQAATGKVMVKTVNGSTASPDNFIIPVYYLIEAGPIPEDIAYDPIKDDVWVVNSGIVEGNRGTVSIIEPNERKVISTIIVGAHATEIAISPKAELRVALVTNYGDGTVSVINVNNRTKIADIKTGSNPIGTAISPDGKWGYIVNSGIDIGTVSVLDIFQLKIVAVIKVGHAPSRVIFSKDGREAYVNNTEDGTISVIRVKSHTVSDTISVGQDTTSNPQEVEVSYKDTYPLWIPNTGSRSVSLISIDRSVLEISVGITPGDIALISGENAGISAGHFDKAMALIQYLDGQYKIRLQKMYGTGGGIKGIAVSQDNAGVFIVHPEQNAVSVFDIKTYQQRAIVKLPDFPYRCIVMDNNRFACIICRKGDSLVLLDIASVLPP